MKSTLKPKKSVTKAGDVPVGVALEGLVSEPEMACDFHEPYFGASYPDATCIDGYLWDLDSCHEPGGDLHSGGDVPCPQCNHAAWLDTFDDSTQCAGYEACERGEPREYVHSKVRHEQPGDEEKCRTWWLAGWDLCAKERSESAANDKRSEPA